MSTVSASSSTPAPAQELEVLKSSLDFTLDNLPSSVAVIRDEDKEVYLVGTAHVSKQSVEEVKRVIELVQPDYVLVELCYQRRGMLQDNARQLFTQQLSWGQIAEQMQRNRNTGLQLLISKFYKQVSESLDVLPGDEFRVAAKLATALNARILLADRPVQVTLSRAWLSLSPWEKCRFIVSTVCSMIFIDLFGISAAEIEDLKNQDTMEQLLNSVAKSFPSFYHALKTERDLYMAYKVRTCPGKRVVGVFGLGHLKGIVQHYHSPVDILQLETVPVPQPLTPGQKRLRVVKALGAVSLLTAAAVMGTRFALSLVRRRRQ